MPVARSARDHLVPATVGRYRAVANQRLDG